MKLDQSYFPLDRVVRLGIIKFKNGQPFLPPHAQSPSEILWLTLFPPKEPLIIIAHKKKEEIPLGTQFSGVDPRNIQPSKTTNKKIQEDIVSSGETVKRRQQVKSTVD